jgi:hypothetical protein
MFSFCIFTSDHSNPAEFTFHIVGSFGENLLKDMVPLLDTYIGSIPAKTGGIFDPQEQEKRTNEAADKLIPSIQFPSNLSSDMVLKLTITPAGIKTDVIYAGEDPIARVRISFPVDSIKNLSEKDVTDIFCTVLNSRLTKELRFKMGGVYSVSGTTFYCICYTESTNSYTILSIHNGMSRY